MTVGRPPGSRSAAARRALGDNVLSAPRKRECTVVCRVLSHLAPPCIVAPAAWLLSPPVLPTPAVPCFLPPHLPSSPRAQTPPTSCSHHVLHACHRSLALLSGAANPWSAWRGCASAPMLAPSPLNPLALRAASSTSLQPCRGSLPATPPHAPVPAPILLPPTWPAPAMHPGRLRRRLQAPSSRAQPKPKPPPPSSAPLFESPASSASRRGGRHRGVPCQHDR